MARSPPPRYAPPNTTSGTQSSSYIPPDQEPRADAEKSAGSKKSWKDVLSAPRRASGSNGAGNADAGGAPTQTLTEENISTSFESEPAENHEQRKESPLAIMRDENAINGEIAKQGAVDLPMKGLCDALICANILQSEPLPMPTPQQIYLNGHHNGHEGLPCANNSSGEESESDRAERSRQISLNAGAAEFSPTPSSSGAGLPCSPPVAAPAGMPGFYPGGPSLASGMYPTQPLPPGAMAMDVMPFFPSMGGGPFYGGAYGFQVPPPFPRRRRRRRRRRSSPSPPSSPPPP